MVDVFLASVTVPFLLVGFCPDECEWLVAIWTTCLRVVLEHTDHAGSQREVLSRNLSSWSFAS